MRHYQLSDVRHPLSATSPKNQKYPQLDSNQRTRLRRPVLYPLSYGGYKRQSTTSPCDEQNQRVLIAKEKRI